MKTIYKIHNYMRKYNSFGMGYSLMNNYEQTLMYSLGLVLPFLWLIGFFY